MQYFHFGLIAFANLVEDNIWEFKYPPTESFRYLTKTWALVGVLFYLSFIAGNFNFQGKEIERRFHHLWKKLMWQSAKLTFHKCVQTNLYFHINPIFCIELGLKRFNNLSFYIVRCCETFSLL